MAENDTPTRVRDLIAKQLGLPVEQVADGADLIGDLGGDSLDIVEVIMSAEEEFGIQITDDEANAMNSVGDAIRLIESKLGERAAA